VVKPALCFGLFSSKQGFVFAVSNTLTLSDSSAERVYNTLQRCFAKPCAKWVCHLWISPCFRRCVQFPVSWPDTVVKKDYFNLFLKSIDTMSGKKKLFVKTVVLW